MGIIMGNVYIFFTQKYSGHLAQFFNGIIWAHFICLQCKSPYTVYCWLCIETRGGGNGVLNMDIFVLVERSSLGTNALIIVKILS